MIRVPSSDYLHLTDKLTKVRCRGPFEFLFSNIPVTQSGSRIGYTQSNMVSPGSEVHPLFVVLERSRRRHNVSLP